MSKAGCFDPIAARIIRDDIIRKCATAQSSESLIAAASLICPFLPDPLRHSFMVSRVLLLCLADTRVLLARHSSFACAAHSFESEEALTEMLKAILEKLVVRAVQQQRPTAAPGAASGKKR